MTAVTKGVCGAPPIARALLRSGIRSFGESRLDNIQRMRRAGIQAEFILIRPPGPSAAASVVETADVSLNTEPAVIRLLSEQATRQGIVHRVILMVELGDLREGIMPSRLEAVVATTLPLPGVELVGIGTNLACLNGVVPTAAKMNELSSLAQRIEETFDLELSIVSGGNSANYQWLTSSPNLGRVNHLRIGEAILLGRETVQRQGIKALSQEAFTLVGEVVEVKTKPSRPYGKRGLDAFGHTPQVSDVGSIRRAIIALGAQDVDPGAIRPRLCAPILGACSDQLVLHDRKGVLHVGKEVTFDVDYGALLRVMTSPYVYKCYSPAAHRELWAMQRWRHDAVGAPNPLDSPLPASRRARGGSHRDTTASHLAETPGAL